MALGYCWARQTFVLWGQWLSALLRTLILHRRHRGSPFHLASLLLRREAIVCRLLCRAAAVLPSSTIRDLHVLHTCQHLFAGLQLAYDGWMAGGIAGEWAAMCPGQTLHVSVGQLYTDLPSN